MSPVTATVQGETFSWAFVLATFAQSIFVTSPVYSVYCTPTSVAEATSMLTTEPPRVADVPFTWVASAVETAGSVFPKSISCPPLPVERVGSSIANTEAMSAANLI